jgi:hypothetical protein
MQPPLLAHTHCARSWPSRSCSAPGLQITPGHREPIKHVPPRAETKAKFSYTPGLIRDDNTPVPIARDVPPPACPASAGALPACSFNGVSSLSPPFTYEVQCTQTTNSAFSCTSAVPPACRQPGPGLQALAHTNAFCPPISHLIPSYPTTATPRPWSTASPASAPIPC